MQIKICGLRDPENIREIAALQPDFMGFIFYPNSPRYVGQLDAGSLTSLPTSIKKTGVFVNENLENILTAISKYNLDAVQLYGADNKKLCRKIRQEAKTMVIKVFPIMDASNFRVTGDYQDVADYFLFDTKTDLYGGSGQKFNWNILQEYTGNKSFLLSGGIGADDVKALRAIEHPLLAGVDLNSKFELKPGLKNVALLKQFIDELKLPPNPLKGEKECEV